MKTKKNTQKNMKYLVLIGLMLLSSMGFANIEGTSKPPNDDDGKGKIQGLVLDQKTKSPMEFANIAIFKRADSTLITGGITNEKGEFDIPDVGYGEYFVEANFIGFDKSIKDSITLDRQTRIANLGIITLQPATVALGAIDVVADKAAIEYKLDKKIVNVSQVISAIGGTAVDVLENTPSVQVDIEGNVSLRGSGNFTVLIDGRPSVLSGSDALRQIPSSAIENIEIITNPSAKYEPDGTAGIINLVMKKNSIKGLNGIINTSIGKGDKYKGDFMLNYRFEKVNLFFGADWRDETNYGNMFSEREIYGNDTTEYLQMESSRDDTRTGHNIKGGSDFYLSDNSTLTFSGEVGNSKRSNDGGGKMENYTLPASKHVYSVTEEVSDRENDFYSLNMNFQHKFNDEGHRLEASAFFSDEKGTDQEIEGELLANADFKPGSEYLSRVSTVEKEDEQEFRFKLDYTNPFSEKGQFEAGLQSRMENENEELDFRDYEQQSSEWIVNNEYSSTTNFKRHIHALYSTFSNKLGKLEYMGGIRGELTLREIKNTKAEEASTLNRFDLFPTAHISYPLSEKTDITSSYSRRINRPSGRDLDPTASYYNRYAIRFGNPDLKPEYTNSYEIGMLKRLGESRSFVSADLFRRISNNKIDRRTEQGEDGVFYYYTDNFDKDYATGIEITANFAYKKWLILNASTDIFHYQITGEIDGKSIDRESTNWGGRMNTTFKLGENSRFQATAFLRGPSVRAQGESKTMFFSSFAYRQEFLDKKLSATLSFRDPFGTAKYEGISYNTSFYNSFRFQREPRVVMLTLSYRINNFKEERNSNRGGGGMNMEGAEF